MPYLTAGWAYGGGSSGSALGGGVEFRLMPNISVKAEYLHVNLDFPDDVVRVGLNWHINLPGPTARP